MTPFGRFAARWASCQRCLLCQRRGRVVLARGRVPATVLLVGEAPGESENTLGEPFCGPAGHLLNSILSKALPSNPGYCLSNIICCIPKLPLPVVVNAKRGRYDVRIDRQSDWGNPHIIGRDGDRQQVIDLYRRWLPKQLGLMKRLKDLAGKRLGCWCKPLACHGDVIVEEFRRTVGDKLEEPPSWAVEACKPRLLEFIKLVNPRLIVRLGKVASRYCPVPKGCEVVDITHPAAILRMDASQKPLAIQRAIVVIEDAVAALG